MEWLKDAGAQLKDATRATGATRTAAYLLTPYTGGSLKQMTASTRAQVPEVRCCEAGDG